MSSLPTAEHVLTHALYGLNQAALALSDARDWLNSDVSGEGWTRAQAARKRDIFTAIQTAKTAINTARHTHTHTDTDSADA